MSFLVLLPNWLCFNIVVQLGGRQLLPVGPTAVCPVGELSRGMCVWGLREPNCTVAQYQFTGTSVGDKEAVSLNSLYVFRDGCLSLHKEYCTALWRENATLDNSFRHDIRHISSCNLVSNVRNSGVAWYGLTFHLSAVQTSSKSASPERRVA